MSMEMTRGYTQSTRLFLDMSAPAPTFHASWTWNNQALPPLNGQVRTDSRDWLAATKLAIDRRSDDGIDRSASLALMKAGDGLRLEHYTDPTRWARYSLTAAPLRVADYYDCAVLYGGGGGALPNSGTRVLLTQTAPGTTSSAFDGRSYADFGVLLPDTFKGTQISFLVSSIADGDFHPLYNPQNQLVALTVAPQRAYTLPSDLIGWPFWRIVSNAAETGVSIIIVAQA